MSGRERGPDRGRGPHFGRDLEFDLARIAKGARLLVLPDTALGGGHLDERRPGAYRTGTT